MPPSSYIIRWKGRDSGPYTRKQIQDKLTSGELSLLHRIEVSGRWVGLGEFLNETSPPAVEKAPPPEAPRPAAPATVVHAPIGRLASLKPEKVAPDTRERRVRLGYFLCGLCFVLPVAATLPAVALALRDRRAGPLAESRPRLVLAALFTLLGLAFWSAVRSALSRGML